MFPKRVISRSSNEENKRKRRCWVEQPSRDPRLRCPGGGRSAPWVCPRTSQHGHRGNSWWWPAAPEPSLPRGDWFPHPGLCFSDVGRAPPGCRGLRPSAPRDAGGAPRLPLGTPGSARRTRDSSAGPRNPRCLLKACDRLIDLVSLYLHQASLKLPGICCSSQLRDPLSPSAFLDVCHFCFSAPIPQRSHLPLQLPQPPSPSPSPYVVFFERK